MATAEIIAAFASGALAATIPVVIGVRVRRDDRRHERDMTTAERNHASLATVYPEIMRVAIKMRLSASRVTQAAHEIQIKRPLVFPDDDESLISIQTRMYSFASPDVRQALTAVIELYSEFADLSSNATEIIAREELDPPLPPQYLEPLMECRHRMFEAVERLSDLIRRELVPSTD
jgi:hypothetical protein